MLGGKSTSHRRAFTLRDLLVLMFLAALLLASSAQFAAWSREGSNRIRCGSNLRQIGQAIQIYANENNGEFPRTTFDETANPVPTEYTAPAAPHPFRAGGPGPNDVTAPLFLLLRGIDIGSEVFICPDATRMWDAAPWPGNPAQASNFPGRAHLTYAYVNSYPSQAALAAGFKLNYTLNSDFAIVADMGPAGTAANVPQNLPRAAMLAANSPNHGGQGQNVLYADGHVDWQPTPFCGPQRRVPNMPKDNIYTFGANASAAAVSAGVRGAPVDAEDAVLLPTFDAGPQPSGLSRTERQRRTIFMVVGGVMLGVIAIGIILIVSRQRRAAPPLA